jgi:DNA-binding CsgD family transcriptional regulator
MTANKVTSTEEVLKCIQKNEGKTKKELALLMDIGIETFKYHYRKLLSEKKIEKIDDQTKITTKVLNKLEKYFTYGLTDEQACYKAGVHINTFYNYCRENPDFAESRNIWKDSPIINAKIFVAEKVEEKDEGFTKLVYQQNEMKERANVKVEVGTTNKEVEEEVNSRNVTFSVSFIN